MENKKNGQQAMAMPKRGQPKKGKTSPDNNQQREKINNGENQ